VFVESVRLVAKSAISFFHVRPSVPIYQQGRVPQQFHNGTFTKICRENSNFVKIEQKRRAFYMDPKIRLIVAGDKIATGNISRIYPMYCIILLNITHRTLCSDGNAPMIK
jgi:hypothetical protein